MLKTSKLTKAVYNTNPIHSQPINLYTPSTNSSSGSVCETEPSSISSSYRSNLGNNEDLNPSQTDDSLIDKLKRELAAVKQAKSQIASLYKVKCKSDLDKSAKITKLRLQFEYELSTFCKQDQKDLVCYLQRQLLVREQRITELSYDIEQLKNSANQNGDNRKLEPIQILRFNDPDLVISTNRRLYDEQERAVQRQNIELNDRVKKFERQLEVLKHDQPVGQRDHEKDLIKRALAKQGKDYQRLIMKKDEQIEELNERIQQLSQSNQLEYALRQSNLEKLHLEKRLLSSTSSLNSTTTTHVGPITTTTSTSTTDGHVHSSRSSTPSASSIDSLHHQALQKTNEVLRAEIHRLTQSDEEHVAKLKSQVQHFEELQKVHKQLENKYQHQEEQWKQKINTLESELLTIKSTQSHHQDLQVNIQRLQTEIELSIKERETASILNAQLRHEITNLTSTNERLSDECGKIRAALITKSDEYDSKKRDNEQLQRKNSDLESTIKSFRETNEFQRRLNEENETNKQELKRKQDDFEQFQKMHDTTKREHQATIHLLQDKIHDLERKTELQSLKHDEILLQFESLKKRSDRILPSAIESIRSPHHPSSTVTDSPFEPDDDSAPIPSINTNDRSAQIVVAKYSYEPLKFSPNDHPEIELPLQIGQYYLIYGNIDEDGFYDGRNLEGRYGLIPSNFIELVTNPGDLPENTKYLIQKLTGKILPSNERPSRQREQTFSIESDVFTLPKLTSASSDISSDDLSYSKHVPYPTNLRIEKSLNNSVLIAWNSPLSTTPILGYQVLLDHALYITIPANERTRALIESININEKAHRISIRTIAQRGLSHDQQCTLLISNSKDFADLPTDLRVDRITQTTAVVSWWPASNQITHKLYVNEIEVQTLKPGVYRFKLSGLLPNTMHRVTIRANPSAATTPQQQLTASIEFRTSPFGKAKVYYTVSKNESVQPPRRIQVIPGPQSNTLLVSWEPSSSLSTTRGFRVLIDGRQVQDITNPLNDHTVLNLNTSYPGRYLTVRTLIDNGSESNDSIPIDLDDVLKKNSRLSSPVPLSNGKETNKSLTRSLIESPSITSSMSTDLPQIDLRANTPRTPTHVKSSADSSRNRTPINENLTFDEQRSTSNTPLKTVQIQPSRSFIALFDYDPHAMSPNPDNEEELPFKQGQVIKIYGEQDADGFYMGQTDDGRRGYVPSNMVSEVEVDRSETESHVSTGTFVSSPTKRSPTSSKSLKEMPDENPTSTDENKQPTVNVKDETEPNPPPPTEAPKNGFFDRFKSTFTWNSDEPI